MKKGKWLFISMILIAFTINSCKKGIDDPKFSLKSRKARITERWTMTRGKVGLTSSVSNQAPFNSNFEFTQGQGTLTETGTLIAYTLTYNLYLEFRDSGKFIVTEDLNGLILTCEGEWNFSGKVGDKKNKEDVFIQLNSISSGDTQDHLFNHFGTELAYSIKRLAKDELVIAAHTNYYMNKSGSKGVIESEYTFKKQ